MVHTGNEMINGRWYDSLAYTGTAGEPVEQNLGPNNKRDLPCGGCSLSGFCRSSGTDCAPFREWTDTGNYSDEYDDLALKTLEGRKVLISQEIIDLVSVA